MDIKNIFDEYGIITNTPNIRIDKIKESIDLLKQGKIDYEFRTTIMKNYHNLEKLKKICKYLGKDSKYYIQNFEDSEAVLDKSLISFSKEELKEIEDELKKEFPNVKVRGI
jgi:pyruvate formate lyase activating enzyme